MESLIKMDDLGGFPYFWFNTQLVWDVFLGTWSTQEVGFRGLFFL